MGNLQPMRMVRGETHGPHRTPDPLHRLLHADAAAARAARRVRALRRDILCGVRSYDAHVFDDAVLALRRAQAAASDARLAWVRWRESLRSHAA